MQTPRKILWGFVYIILIILIRLILPKYVVGWLVISPFLGYIVVS